MTQTVNLEIRGLDAQQVPAALQLARDCMLEVDRWGRHEWAVFATGASPEEYVAGPFDSEKEAVKAHYAIMRAAGVAPDFDQFQQIVAESYNGGDHCCRGPEDQHHCGDPLLTYLMTELSDWKGCVSLERAVSRLDRAIHLLAEVRSAFQAKQLA